jgi:hypothetical protein
LCENTHSIACTIRAGAQPHDFRVEVHRRRRRWWWRRWRRRCRRVIRRNTSARRRARNPPSWRCTWRRTADHNAVFHPDLHGFRRSSLPPSAIKRANPSKIRVLAQKCGLAGVVFLVPTFAAHLVWTHDVNVEMPSPVNVGIGPTCSSGSESSVPIESPNAVRVVSRVRGPTEQAQNDDKKRNQSGHFASL